MTDLHPGPARRAMIVTAVLGPALLAGSALASGHGRHSTVGTALNVGGWAALAIGVLVTGILVLRRLDGLAARTGAYATGRVSRVLLLGGWFVPVASLVVPAQQVSDMVRAVRAGGPDDDGTGLAPGVGRWWACWLGGWLLFDVGWVVLPLLPVDGGSPLITLAVVLLLVASSATLVLAAVSLGEILQAVAVAVATPPRRSVPTRRPTPPKTDWTSFPISPTIPGPARSSPVRPLHTPRSPR